MWTTNLSSNDVGWKSNVAIPAETEVSLGVWNLSPAFPGTRGPWLLAPWSICHSPERPLSRTCEIKLDPGHLGNNNSGYSPRHNAHTLIPL